MKQVFTSMGTIAVAVTIACAGTAPSGPITFNKDVLPILQKNCQGCHRPGQIAPMSLLTYKDARPWAKSIKAAVANGKMPPWFADRSASHVKFLDARLLSASEKETLVKWVDSGAAEGDPSSAPPPIQWPEDGWQIKPDVVIKAPANQVPASTKNNVIEWQYVIVPSGLRMDTWVTSIEIRPTSRAVTHHVCAWFQPHRPDVIYNVPQWIDRQRDAVGNEIPSAKRLPLPFSLLGGVGAGFSCYVPGTRAQDFRPLNAGRLVPANSDVVFQIHYNPTGTAAVDQPQIGLTIAQTPPEKQILTLAIQPLSTASFAIPPNADNWEAPVVDTRFTEDADLVWMMPHMHFRGKDMTYRLDYPDGHSQTLLVVKNYDYNWQLGYDIAPLHVPKGSRLVVTAHYDNSANNRFNPNPNQTVYYGDMAWEEMDSPFFAITIDKRIDPKKVLSRGPTAGGA